MTPPLLPARPRLLAVATSAPFPVTDGYTLRVFHLLRALAAGWDIALVAPPGAALPPGMARHVPVALPGTGLSYPWRFDAAPLHAAVAAEIRDWQPHRALVWPGAEALWFDHGDWPPAVADQIDSNTLEFWRGTWRGAWHGNGLRARARNMRQLPVAWATARRTVARYAATSCVGEADAAWLRWPGGAARVHVVPNGVELPPDTQCAPQAPQPTLIFAGSLDYAPNIDAALFAARDIWPIIRARCAHARLVIAGRRPVAAILALHGQHGIEVAADVADMAPVLADAWVSIAPMRQGVGVKNKVLEAWASARPVVMTPLATNGLTLPPDYDALVARDAAGLAAAVLALFADTAGRHAAGEAARAHVTAHFTWDAAGAQLDALLRAAGGQP